MSFVNTSRNFASASLFLARFCPEEDGKAGDNRDHSTAAEVLKDLAKLGDRLKEHIFTSVKVMKVLGEGGNYTVLFDDDACLEDLLILFELSTSQVFEIVSLRPWVLL